MVLMVYNGVRAWPPPEYDETIYPFAYLTRGSTGVISYIASSVRFVRTTSSAGKYVLDYDTTETAVPHITWVSYNTRWSEPIESDNGTGHASIDELIWCNTDLYDDDGTLYMPASVPRKFVLQMYGFLLGMAMALVRNPYPQVLMYDYNGHILPQFPRNWNQEERPCAFIYWHKENRFYAFITSSTMLYRTPAGFQSGAGAVALYNIKNNQWQMVLNSSDYTISMDEEKFDIVWTNTDILNEDSTVWMAATEPVPDYGGGTP